jgi:hypothetical protein
MNMLSVAILAEHSQVFSSQPLRALLQFSHGDPHCVCLLWLGLQRPGESIADEASSLHTGVGRFAILRADPWRLRRL